MLNWNSMAYLEMSVLLIFVACIVVIVSFIKKVINNQKHLMYMIETYEYQMNKMNEHLHNMENDIYAMAYYRRGNRDGT